MEQTKKTEDTKKEETKKTTTSEEKKDTPTTNTVTEKKSKDRILAAENRKTYASTNIPYSGRFQTINEQPISKGAKTSEVKINGFYYDTQLEDPYLSMSLHANTRIDPKTGEWVAWDEVKNIKNTSCLEPIIDDPEHYKWAAKYGADPIARCILSEDLSYSITNNWSDYNGGNPLEGIWENFKPYAPILGKFSRNLKSAINEGKKNKTGSDLVEWFNEKAEKVANLMGSGSEYLNKALYVQGSRFSYYGGTNFNFNNLEMKFIVFSDYTFDPETGTYEFKSVEDYIKTLQPYVMGIYNPYNDEFLRSLDIVKNNVSEKVVDSAEQFIANYVGFQDPPGGFNMETINLNNTLKGTLRLNIGGTWAIDNLILRNMNVLMSRVQAKNPKPKNDGDLTVPLYAEISLQLSPASAFIDSKYRKILDHRGMRNLRKRTDSLYGKLMDEIKTNMLRQR